MVTILYSLLIWSAGLLLIAVFRLIGFAAFYKDENYRVNYHPAIQSTHSYLLRRGFTVFIATLLFYFVRIKILMWGAFFLLLLLLLPPALAIIRAFPYVLSCKYAFFAYPTIITASLCPYIMAFNMLLLA